jgi:type IV secretory pathway VirB6-like protein
MINKNININHNQNSFKKLLCLLFLFLLFSCDDGGCIDSDDFGEYEIFTFSVNANNLEQICKYKSELSDADQGFGIKDCIATNCTDALGKNNIACKKNCEEKCFTDKDALQKLFNASPGGAGATRVVSSEPNWFAVGGGGSIGKISIEQNSQILITAQGTVNLGNTSGNSAVSIVNTDPGNTKLENIRDDTNITKFSGGENLEINFEGDWTDTVSSGSTTTYFNSNSSTDPLIDKRDLLKNKLNYYTDSSANGARRIFAYFIPFPEIYQQYQNYNFPLAPDPRAWLCNGSADTSNKRHLSCSDNECTTPDCYDDYAKLSLFPYDSFPASALLIPSTDPLEIEKKNKYNKTFTDHFNVDNEKKENSRYEGGTGFIRYKDDNLYGTEKKDTNILPAFKVRINSDVLKGGFGFKLDFPTPNNRPYFVTIDNNSAGGLITSGCEIKFEINSNTPLVTNPSSTVILNEIDQANPNNIKNSFTQSPAIEVSHNIIFTDNKKYIFEPEHIRDNNYMIKAQDPATFNALCVLNAYFYPFHEIEFSKSGYVDFGIAQNAMPATIPSIVTASGSSPSSDDCKLKFRIRNQNGKYEDNNFTSHAVINASPRAINATQYFVRKGQKLSFSPESWNGEWTTNYSGDAQKKECGVGFYVNLTPRPAVFCSNFTSPEFININQDTDATNNCVPYYDPTLKAETGCKENYDPCLNMLKTDNSINNKFCPTQCIKKDFSSCRPSVGLTPTKLYQYPSLCQPTGTQTGCCKPTGSEIECYDSTTTPLPAECQTDPTKCSTYVAFANLEPYKSLFASAKTSVLPANTITGATQIFLESSCINCKTAMTADVQKDFYLDTNNANTASLQQCYDIEEYKGSRDELKTIIDRDLESGKPKLAKSIYDTEGVKKIKSFDGTYGNLYPLDYVKTNSISSKDVFKLENFSFINKAGYIKFIALGLIDKTSNNFFELPATRTLNTTNLRISAKSSNELSNGAGLSIALCRESSSTGDECSQTSLTPSQIKDKFSPAPNVTLPILEYNENNSINVISNYKFNDFGQLIRTTNAPIAGAGPEYGRECSNPEILAPSIGKGFLCFKDINNSNINAPNYDASDGNRYRLSFKIIDNETANCKLVGSSYQECAPASPAVPSESCDKFTIINPAWTGLAQGYCDNAEIDCIKKYQCIDDKYLNNNGNYDVAVKIKRDSKIKVSNFINSIISPVLGEIDGFSVNKKNYTGLQTVKDFINTKSFNTPTNGNNFASNTQDNIAKTDLKPKDNNIVDIAYAEGKKDEVIQINPNTSNPECRGNCFISYINFAIYGYQASPSKVSATSGCQKSYRLYSKLILENKCLGKTNCSFIVNESEFTADDGLPYPTTAINSCDINSKKLMVEYTYSTSNEPLFKENQARRIYKSIINNLVFQNFLTLSIVLMLSFYGMGFLMGVSELKQSEIIDRLVKIGLIYLFTNPEFGWVWFEKFFVTFFKNGTDFLTFTMAGIFDETNRIDAIINSGDFSDKSPIFYDVDKVIGLFLVNDVIHKKIASLLFYKFFGIIYVFIIYHSAIAYVYAISNAVLIYLTSQFFTSVLFIVGPIFFVFILFKQTKGFFDNWLNALIGFSLQQIFLVFTLSLFNAILYLIIKSTLGFRICWETVWKINSSFSSISILSFWTPQESPSYISETTDPSVEGSTTGLPTIPILLSLWTVCVIMKSFVTKITELATLLSGGISATEIGSGVASAMNKGIDEVKEKAGEAYERSGAKGMVERADQKLFSSGRLAKAERAKLNKKDKEDQNTKNQMRESGDKAVSEYKINNYETYSKMSEAEKTAKLIEVKKDAMKQTGKDMGLKDKNIEKLMNDRNGRQYRGDNIFGLAKSVGNNFSNNKGRSLNEEALKVDTKMTKNEMNQVLINAGDSDKRKEFVDDVKKGNIRQRKELPNIKDGFQNVIKNIGQGNLREAGSIVGRGLAKTGDAIQRNATKLKDTVLQKDRQNAIKQLESSGDIKKQGYLEKRTQKDEEKIVNKMQENKLSQTEEKGRNMSTKDISRLESFSNKLNEKENEPAVPKKEEAGVDAVGGSTTPNRAPQDDKIDI